MLREGYLVQWHTYILWTQKEAGLIQLRVHFTTRLKTFVFYRNKDNRKQMLSLTKGQ